jgi:hypothetical protein
MSVEEAQVVGLQGCPPETSAAPRCCACTRHTSPATPSPRRRIGSSRPRPARRTPTPPPSAPDSPSASDSREPGWEAANALATGVDVGGGEWPARQYCPYRSPRHRDQIGGLGGAAPRRADARATMPAVADDGDQYVGDETDAGNASECENVANFAVSTTARQVDAKDRQAFPVRTEKRLAPESSNPANGRFGVRLHKSIHPFREVSGSGVLPSSWRPVDSGRGRLAATRRRTPTLPLESTRL